MGDAVHFTGRLRSRGDGQVAGAPFGCGGRGKHDRVTVRTVEVERAQGVKGGVHEFAAEAEKLRGEGVSFRGDLLSLVVGEEEGEGERRHHMYPDWD